MSLPLVSIVIPCYNAEEYIAEAIQSSLDQTYSKVEVIVIDDGSTDGSLNVIRSFGEAVRWKTGPNCGPAAARNRGVEISRGDFIQFLDADDLLYPRKVVHQIPLVIENVADIVVCDWEVGPMDKPQQTTRCSGAFDGADQVVQTLFKEVHTPSPILSKELFNSVGGFRRELPCSEDHDLYLRLACAGATFAHMPEVLYRVRKVSNSVSSNKLRLCDQYATIYWPAYTQLQEDGKLTQERAEAFAKAMFRTAKRYLRLGKTAEARKHFQFARDMHMGGGISGRFSRQYQTLSRVVGPVLSCRIATTLHVLWKCLVYSVRWAWIGSKTHRRTPR